MDLLYNKKGTLYVCGNNGMAKAVEIVIKSAIKLQKGFNEKNVDTEYFRLQSERHICVEAWG